MKLLLAALVVAMFPAAASATAVGIAPKGQTTVEVQKALLSGLGLGGAPTGTGQVSELLDSFLFAFDITGGTIDTHAGGAAVIRHDGSGVRLFALADTNIGAEVGNFVIDTAAETVSGNVNGGMASAVLFNFGVPSSTGIPLLISTDLGNALGATFGVNPAALIGAEFALANTAPMPVPLPAGLPLLLAGLGAIALVRRISR